MMGSRGGGGGGGGVAGIPAGSRKVVDSLKEIVNGVSDVEIYAALKECNMDPNEAVNRLLSQDPFHEVKSKRDKKKESKDTTEYRPRGGGSTSSRGGRSGTDRYSGRGGSSQYNSSESGGYNGKPKRENGTNSYGTSSYGTNSYGSSSYGTSSYTQSSAPSYGAAPTNTNWNDPPSYSGSAGYENKASTYSAADVPAIVPQESSGYQSAWLGAPGQKSMADIVKMGKPQNKPYNAPAPPQPSSTQYDEWDSNPSEVYQQHNVSTDDDWPVMEPPQVVNVQSVSEPPVEPEVVSQSNLPYESNQYIASQIDEPQAEDEGVYEDHTVPDSVTSRQLQDDTSGGATFYDNDVNKNVDSYHLEDYAYEQNEVEEGDASASSISANMQQLNIQEERHVDEPEQDVPSVVIPNHLQVQSAECSHLSFGSFGATMNPGFSGSRQVSKVENEPAEADISSARPSESRNPEYYGDESIITSESNLANRTGPSSESYDLSSASQTEVLKQENPEVAHGNQYGYSSSAAAPGYTFDGTQLLNPAFPQSQTSTQLPNAAPFSNVMQAAYTNSLPSTLLAANGHPVRESDLSYSQFPTSQSMATKYGSSVSSIGGSTISMAEALKTGAFSSSQPTQQTLPGNSLPTGPALPQHLVHPYSQPTLPLGPFANMIGYPFLPQSYTYMSPAFQQAFAGNSTYHQQLAAGLPQYKNSVSVSSLPQSAAVPSGYGSYGNSTALPGNYQVNQPAGPAGSALSYDDVLANHYKESQLLSLQQQQQQQNDNSAMWVQGAGSRAVPANTYYSFQGQNQQQPSGYRQGQQQQQQPSQGYGGAAFNYPNYYQSQTGISQDHQLQQNPRDGSLVGGSQGQPKPQQQSQQLW